MKRIIRALAVSAVATGLLLTGAACSTIAEPETIVLQYSGGSVEGTKFTTCIEPSEKGAGVINDHNFVLPVSLRTWNIRPEGGDTNVPINSATKQGADGAAGPAVSVWAKVEFYLNTDCKNDKGEVSKDSPVVQFWEKTGRRYQADTPEGWRNMLLNTLVPAEEGSLRAELRKYTADQLDANTDGIWDRIEAAASKAMGASVRSSVGGDYFCGPAFQRGAIVSWEESQVDPVTGAVTPVTPAPSGKCPPVKIEITEIDFADPGIQAARTNVRKAQEDARANLIAAEAKVKEAELLAKANRNPQYLEFERLERDLEISRQRTRQVELCAANPNCTVIVSDGSAGVNINGR